MSKEEFLKIQTCVLKVNIHCDGCKQKVKKILQKIDGVYTTNIDSEQGKVTVSGNVDPATLIKKLTKNGKHAEIWGASKANNNNQNQMNNQFKNLQIDNGSKGGKNKGQAPKGGGNNQPKGGLQAQNPQLQQQLQQLQQFKGLQDLKMPPQFMKDLKVANNNKDLNQKSVKFNLPEDEGLSDDDFDDDDFDDDGDYDDDFDDELDDIPVVNNKMKPPVLAHGHGGAQMDNMMMNNIMNGQHPQLMKGGGNGGNNGGNGGGNGKKGGGGNMPVQMNLGGGNQNQGGANGGKKGGNGNNNGGNQNQGGGKGGKNGGGQPNDGKNGGGGQNKGGGGGGAGAGAVNGNSSMGNGGKKGGGVNDGPHGMPNMMPMSTGGNVGPLGTNMQMRQMGNLPMGQMNNLAAVQGLPASAMTGGGGGGAGYFPATTPEHMAANPYYQQQLAAMMMNQQRANGNERFQPMMYARPPPAVNYMPPYPPHPYPHPYAPYAPPQGERTDEYTMFSDENTSSCNVM